LLLFLLKKVCSALKNIVQQLQLVKSHKALYCDGNINEVPSITLDGFIC
jgi:hypothetical protein